MKKILLIPGDGIGQEVMREAKKLLLAFNKYYGLELTWDEADWGAEKWLREGIGLPQDAVTTICNNYHAILFGALGDPRIPDMAHGREILLGLRFGLDLYINLRPVKLWHPRLSVLRDPSIKIDLVIVRENTEDLYRGFGYAVKQGSRDEVTIDESRHSYQGVWRIIDAAFRYAQDERRKRVTLIDKANAIKFGGKLWTRAFNDVKSLYPSIEANHLYVDVAAMYLVQDPSRFDVIVTSNLFGDILSDLGAGLVGGLGLAASANINPKTLALFEPVHGSAPDIAFKDAANPLAMFLTIALMFKYFAWLKEARAIEKAVAWALDRGATTKDLGGTLRCSEVGSLIVDILRSS
jgi:3-isopropylmalate dehydrogenase